MSSTERDGIRYDIAAIETEYRGYKFRSRLEAKWAAFFDALDWDWEYEPVEYNGWFPDFSIRGEEGNVILVEVKPILSLTDGLKERLSKVKADGHEILVAGLNYRSAWLFDGGWFAPVAYGKWTAGRGKFGFCHSENSYTDRISGGYDGGHYGSIYVRDYEIHGVWAAACNETQWKKSRQ